jgi:COX assembly mitochondrial protein 2
MHPPLDRPHPDCQEEILALKSCHADGWKKFYGACNKMKVAVDQCFKKEKDRLLVLMNQDFSQERQQHEQLIKVGFSKKETFQEYLQKDAEYQQALRNKKQESPPPAVHDR